MSKIIFPLSNDYVSQLEPKEAQVGGQYSLPPQDAAKIVEAIKLVQSILSHRDISGGPTDIDQKLAAAMSSLQLCLSK